MDFKKYFKELDDINEKVNLLLSSVENDDELFFIKTIQLGIEAAKDGTFGVGAVLVDKNNNILSEGKNMVFSDKNNSFFSSEHAEINTLRNYENNNIGKNKIQLYKDTKLYVSLETCIMCTGAIINAGIKDIKYIERDPFGACDIAKKIKNGEFPAWKNIMEENNTEFNYINNINPEISKLANKLFTLTIPYVDNKLQNLEKKDDLIKLNI